MLNSVVYLMFLNGILFLGLNFVAHCIVQPGPRGSRKKGYAFIVTAVLAFCVQQEYNVMIHLEFDPEKVRTILLGGFVIPVFALSLVFYRYQRSRREKKASGLNVGTENDNN